VAGKIVPTGVWTVLPSCVRKLSSLRRHGKKEGQVGGKCDPRGEHHKSDLTLLGVRSGVKAYFLRHRAYGTVGQRSAVQTIKADKAPLTKGQYY